MGLEILEIAIGIIFVYLLVSLLCTAVREGLESFMKTRGAYLWLGIRQLLDDKQVTGLAASFYDHPLIYSLFPGDFDREKRLDKPKMIANGKGAPSYIPSRNFAVVLMDIAARGPLTHDATSTAGAPAISLENIRTNIANIGNPQVQRVLLNAVDAARGDINKAQADIEAWYDSAMDRVSGWYKRTTQWWLLVIGFVAAVGLNVNTLAILDYLAAHPKERSALADRADTYMKKVGEADEKAADENEKADEADAKAGNEKADQPNANTTKASPSNKRNYEEAQKMLNGLNLPIGWKGMKFFSCAELGKDKLWLTAVVAPLFGWLLTAFAASLGAPFWFDLLNKVMVIRSTVKPHEKSPEEGSEDRQPKTQQPAATVTPPPTTPPPPAPPPPLPDAGSPSVTGRDPEANLDDSHASITTATEDSDLPEAKGGVQ